MPLLPVKSMHTMKFSSNPARMNCRNEAFSWNTHFMMVSEPSADSPVKGSVWFWLWRRVAVVE